MKFEKQRSTAVNKYNQLLYIKKHIFQSVIIKPALTHDPIPAVRVNPPHGRAEQREDIIRLAWEEVKVSLRKLQKAAIHSSLPGTRQRNRAATTLACNLLNA